LDLGALHLFDIDRYFAARQAAELVTELVDLGATLPDHHARTGRVHGQDDLLRLTLDLDFGDGRMGQALMQVLPELLIFDEKLREVTLGIPARLPGADDSESEPARMYFLSQSATPYGRR